MPENNKALEQLIQVSHEQTDNIDKLADAILELDDRVEQRPTSKKVWKVVASVAAAIVAFMMFLNYLSYDASIDTLHRIDSCINPEEECAQLQAAESAIVRGQIVCNQEKIIYFIAPEVYHPLPFCIDIINSELERGTLIDEEDGPIPTLPVPENIPQVPPLKDTFTETLNLPAE